MRHVYRKSIPIFAVVAVVAAAGGAAIQAVRPQPAPRGNAAVVRLVAAAAGVPAPDAAPVPVSLPLAPRSMPDDYHVLLTRSIFMRGLPRAAAPPAPVGNFSRAAPGPPPKTPEAKLAFRGALREGTRLIAFIEDTDSHNTMRLKVGDAFGRGKVRQITLDHVVYELAGKLTTVDVGRSLDGAVAIAPTTRPADASSTASAAAPAGAASSAPAAAGSSPAVDDIVEKLRKKRQQEEGGK